MAMESQYVWMNGRLVDFRDATLHFLTAGLHYGVGVFEGIRCYATESGPAVFRLREHIDRLFDSALVLGWRELPFTPERLCEAVLEVIAANGFSECYIRPLIYLGEGGFNLTLDSGKAHVGIAAWEWNAYISPDALEKGIRANTSSFTRHHANAAMSKAKIAGNYVNSVLARTESLRLGFEEAIMLDTQGYVAECTGENLFVVRKGTVYTTPAAEVLEGITRDTIMQLARDMGLAVVEAPLSRDQLYVADEVFVTGTAAELLAICEIDFRKIAGGKAGTVTCQLQAAFGRVTRGRDPKHHDWLELVPVLRDRSELSPGASLDRTI
jgi:branched-chain amino acid aminotransferase